MSRDAYGAPNLSGSAGGGGGGIVGGGNRSPRGAGSRRLAGELPTVDCSPSRQFPGSGRRGAPRSGNASPVLLDHGGYSGGGGGGGYATSGGGGGGYYRDEDLGSPTLMMDERGRGMGSGGHHRSRSASRPAMSSAGGGGGTRYQSLDRAAAEAHDRDFVPIRDRERSLERGLRDRSLERGVYEDELYRPGARASPLPRAADSGVYINELQQQNSDLQRELANFKKELELTNQKLGSSMHSIKTFWSPELKKERALRKEESAKYSLINDQLKLLNSENQKQAMLVRQLEEELRLRARNPSAELTQQVELLYAENEHLTREIAILRETIKELELRIETQKQTLAARDESIKKLLEMLQNKGVGGKMLDEERVAIQTLQARLIESEDKVRHYETLVRHREQELCKTERELKATNETLKALQMQLEKAFRTQNSSGAASNSTLTAILETKDARIATLEKEVALLELELDRIRECGAVGGGGVGLASLDASAPAAAAAAAAAASAPAGGKRQLEEFRAEVQRRDQEILAMSAKMKTLEEQHTDYQRHIAVLKESLCAKEEHYNMLQADVEELRQRLEEKNRHIEKKTLTATQAQQERNRLSNELNELRDHMDIKDRKINVLQRKLDLQEANKKAAAGSARAGEEAAALRQQVEEQKRQLEEQRRRLEEASRGADGRSRQLEERERALADAEVKLKRRKEKVDQQEAQLQKAQAAAAASGGPGAADAAQAQARLAEVQAELQKAREDAQHSQVETERLLRLVQMSQEEQNQKEKTIRDLQEALKTTQAKLRSQQQANAQMREEVKQQQQQQQQQQRQQQERERERERAGDGDGASDPGGEADDEEDDEPRKTDAAAQTQANGANADANALARKDREIVDLQEEVMEGRQRVEELQAEVTALEAALHEQSGLEELEELVAVVRLKDDRIAELEEALRESVRITAERERALQHEEARRRQVAEKVGKLEQRLLSLQTAHALRCSTCRPLLSRSQDLEKRLARLLAERSSHLRELAAMKQEALEAAISEKDAHLALLEVSGLRTARQAEQAERLRADRRRLMERLKRETEHSVQLLQQYAPPEPISPAPSPPFCGGGDGDDEDEEAAEEQQQQPAAERGGTGGAATPRSGRSTPRSAPSTPRHNGHPPAHNAHSEVEPDSLDPASSSETTPSM